MPVDWSAIIGFGIILLMLIAIYAKLNHQSIGEVLADIKNNLEGE